MGDYRTSFLQRCDQLKDDVQAPLYGHYLAHCASKQSDTVRYFGLGLLEDAVRFKWHTGVYAPDDKVRIPCAAYDNRWLLAAFIHFATSSGQDP